MRLELNGLLLTASLLICSCGVSDKPAQTIQSPDWESSPNLPNRPSQFCSKAVAVFQGQFQSIKCQDRLAGAYGIRGNFDNTELVVLQGVDEKWFAMAFQNARNQTSNERISNEELAATVNRLEAAFGD